MSWWGISRLENLLSYLGLSPFGDAGLVQHKLRESIYFREIEKLIDEKIKEAVEKDGIK